jgi:Luciferase-like monooxygenase
MTGDRPRAAPPGGPPIRTLRLAVEAAASSAAAVEFVRQAERLGVHAAWAAEMWGYDAFTIGAMGSGTTNFYNEAFARQGFGDEVRTVQRLWAEGRREEAARLVPLAIGQKTNLLGTAAMVRERVRLYRGAGIGTLAVKLSGPLRTRLDTLAQLTELVDEVNREEPA